MKLLIVEDAMLVRKRLTAFFRAAAGLEVDEAADAAMALERLRAWRPDIVTLDIALPASNGIELLKTIKSERPETRVLMFSNHVFCRESCMAAGADGFFDKARDFEELAAAVCRLADTTAPAAGESPCRTGPPSSTA